MTWNCHRVELISLVQRWSKAASKVVAMFDQPIQQEHGLSGPDGLEYCHLPHLSSFAQIVVASLRVPSECQHAECLIDL